MDTAWKKVVNPRQRVGIAYLWEETPRSLRFLFLIFIGVFAAYWLLKIAYTPFAEPFHYALAIMLSFSIVLFLFQTFPKLRRLLPSSIWPQDNESIIDKAKHTIVLISIAAIVFALSLAADYLTVGVISLMGLAGGVYIQIAGEHSVHGIVIRLKKEKPKYWKGVIVAAVLMIILLFAYIAAVVLVALTLPSPEATSGPQLPLIILFGLLIAAQAVVILSFLLVRILAYVQKKWKNGLLKRIPGLDTNPFSQFLYLEGTQHFFMILVFMYILLIVYQTMTMISLNSDIPSVGWGLMTSAVPASVLQLLVLGSFAISWITMSFNIIGMAIGERVPFLTKHNIISASLVILMILLMHTVVAQGNEILFSIMLRSAYLIGLILGPLIVLIIRFRKIREERETPPSLAI